MIRKAVIVVLMLCGILVTILWATSYDTLDWRTWPDSQRGVPHGDKQAILIRWPLEVRYLGNIGSRLKGPHWAASGGKQARFTAVAVLPS